tara:strand:+ start:3121 stop:3909 length:789 start_codon:yes stop_codon:yes gene_type:complete
MRKTNTKLLTFCLCLKNRPTSALESIATLVNDQTIKHCNFIVTEDISNNLLDLSQFKFKNHIDHYIIDTKDTWNRSKTCNYGFKRATTPFVSSWDADFLFSSNIHITLANLIKRADMKKEYLRVWTTETASGSRRGTTYEKGSMYGGMYIYDQKRLAALGGYDEKFINYGWEEIDFNHRYSLQFSSREKWIRRKGLVYHKTHDESISGDKSFYDINKGMRDSNIVDRRFVVNEKGWGQAKLLMKVDYTQDNPLSNLKVEYNG